MSAAESAHQPVLCAVTGGVARIELNRPEAFNALDLDMAIALRAALGQVATDESVRVVVLSGAGRSFCAGGDVKGMAAATDREGFLFTLASAAHQAVLALVALDLPVIVVVQGAAAGAGLTLTMACDIVLAADSARFLTAYAGVGLTPDCGTSWLLPRIVGQRRALELALTGRVLSAAEALDWGLITQVCTEAELHEVATTLAVRLAAGPVPALGAARRLIRDSPERSLRDHLEAEAASIARAGGSADSRSLVDKFATRSAR